MMIEQDEAVQMHIGFVSHFLGKKSLFEETKENVLIPISKTLFTDENLLTSHKQVNNFKVPSGKNMPFLQTSTRELISRDNQKLKNSSFSGEYFDYHIDKN